MSTTMCAGENGNGRGVITQKFEYQFSTKEEAAKAAAAFQSTLPLLQASEYKDNVVLITGANKGIGYEVARQLGAKGLKVLLGCRDPQRGKEALTKLQQENKDAFFQLVDLEVSDAASVSAAVEFVSAAYGKLDVLVNNAAICPDWATPSQVDGSQLRKVFETNVFGPMLLNKAFIPLLEKSSNARIVNVTSGLGSFDIHTDPSIPYFHVNISNYCTSKTVLNMYTVLLANEFRGKNSNIRVNAVCPGYTDTDLNNHQGKQTVQEAAESIVVGSLLGPNGPTGQYINRFGYIKW